MKPLDANGIELKAGDIVDLKGEPSVHGAIVGKVLGSDIHVFFRDGSHGQHPAREFKRANPDEPRTCSRCSGIGGHSMSCFAPTPPVARAYPPELDLAARKTFDDVMAGRSPDVDAIAIVERQWALCWRLLRDLAILDRLGGGRTAGDLLAGVERD